MPNNQTSRARLPRGPIAALAFLAIVLTVGLLASNAAGRTSGAPQADDSQSEHAATTLFLVRHAEKGSDDPQDPSLTPDGRRRAIELARVLSEVGVTHLFTSDLKRTRETLAPLVRVTGLVVKTYDVRNPGDILSKLRALPAGSVAVVSGHSNTTPQLYGTLSGATAHSLEETPYGVVIPEDAYDRLYCLTLLRGEAGEPVCISSFELRYGE